MMLPQQDHLMQSSATDSAALGLNMTSKCICLRMPLCEWQSNGMLPCTCFDTYEFTGDWGHLPSSLCGSALPCSWHRPFDSPAFYHVTHTRCLVLYSSWKCFIHLISWLDWSDILQLWSPGQIREPYFILINQSQDNDNSPLIFDDHANSFLFMILAVLFWHRRPYASASISKLLFKAIVTRCFMISRFPFHASLWCSHDSTA